VSISESAGAGATTGTVTRNGDTTNALVVTLASDDSSEVQVASSVTIPAGQTSATFDLDASDDILLDGPKTVTITASATNFTSGTLTITVTDDDVASLTLTADSTTVSETAGTAATMITLSRNTPTTTDLVVDLASSDTSELDVAQTVVIPAGQVSVRFPVDAVDDLIVDGPKATLITATAAGLVSGTESIVVTDNDVPTLTLQITAASVNENDGPAATTATVRRNTSITSSLTVTVTSSDVAAITVPQTVTIPAGRAFVEFDLNAVDDAVADGSSTATISVAAANHAGDSNTIDVVDDEFAALRILLDDTSVAEADGAAAVTGTVIRNTDNTNPLRVTLQSSDTSEVTVIGSVTIPAGAFITTFSINAIDEAIVDGVQTVTITGSVNLVDRPRQHSLYLATRTTRPRSQSRWPITAMQLRFPGRLLFRREACS